jgi:hypothetical protein
MSTTKTTHLFLLDDLDDEGKTGELARRDLDALRTLADWIRTYVARPNEEIGRPGPVCPFVPAALERGKLWLAPEQVADRDASDVVELMDGYRRLFLGGDPVEGEDVIVVAFTDLPADRAQDVFDDVLDHLSTPSYVEDGVVYGPFHERFEGTAIYNSSFRPFRSPVPFLFVRYGVVSDWKFFLDNDFFGLWARRYGEAAVHELAGELRRLPWNKGGLA